MDPHETVPGNLGFYQLFSIAIDGVFLYLRNLLYCYCRDHCSDCVCFHALQEANAAYEQPGFEGISTPFLPWNRLWYVAFLKISILITVLSGEPIPELSVPDGFLWMATSVLLLPVVEELLVRGMLFGSFSRFISYPKAIVFSATFFLFGHTKVSWPAVFVIGILLAWIYWRTDNLAVTMVIHGTTNFGSLLATPLYILLTTHRTIGVIVCLFVVFLGILITYLSTKMFLKKHDALPT